MSLRSQCTHELSTERRGSVSPGKLLFVAAIVGLLGSGAGQARGALRTRESPSTPPVQDRRGVTETRSSG